MSRVACQHSLSVSSPSGAANFFSTRQLAELIGVSPRKLERDRQDGTGIPFVKFGRRVLYRRVDIEHFLEAQRFSSTAEVRREWRSR